MLGFYRYFSLDRKVTKRSSPADLLESFAHGENENKQIGGSSCRHLDEFLKQKMGRAAFILVSSLPGES